MGKTTAGFFSRHGWETYIISRNKRKGAKVARKLGAKSRTFREIGDSDIVAVSVPISKTLEICLRSAKLMKPGSLLIDLASVKTPIVKKVARSLPKGINYLSMHQLFGGNVEWKGQNVILCPGRCSARWMKKMKSMLRKEGVKLRTMSPEAHDKKTAVTQVARHLLTLSFSRYLSEYHKGESLDSASTPDFRRLMEAVESLSGQKGMVMGIQKANRYGKKERERIIRVVEKLIREVGA